jgi:hypothetical protein
MRRLSWPVLIFILLFVQSLSAQQKDISRRDVPAPPRTVEDVLAVLDQYKPDPAKLQELRAASIAEPPKTDNRQQLAIFYHRRARVNGELGDLRQATADLKKHLNSFLTELRSQSARGLAIAALFSKILLQRKSLGAIC